MTAAFPCKWIVERFISEYDPAIDVLFILFSTEVLYLLIRGIYVNLYKARMQQNIYFKKLTYVIVLAMILNVVFFQILHTKEAFAYATLISTFIWLLFCVKDFKEVRLDMGEMSILVLSILLFVGVGILLNTYVAFAIYAGYLVFLVLIPFRKEVRYLITKFI